MYEEAVRTGMWFGDRADRTSNLMQGEDREWKAGLVLPGLVLSTWDGEQGGRSRWRGKLRFLLWIPVHVTISRRQLDVWVWSSREMSRLERSVLAGKGESSLLALSSPFAASVSASYWNVNSLRAELRFIIVTAPELWGRCDSISCWGANESISIYFTYSL